MARGMERRKKEGGRRGRREEGGGGQMEGMRGTGRKMKNQEKKSEISPRLQRRGEISDFFSIFHL
jgi:hypothetical protein